MKQFGFPGINRVRSQQDFAEIYSARQRAGDQNLLVFAVKTGWIKVAWASVFPEKMEMPSGGPEKKD